MKPKVFISQNDEAGRGAAKTIYDHLTSPPLDIDAFLSTGLPAGQDFVQAILEDLPRGDLQFFVIDPKTRNSAWMKWEHDFCKQRNIQTIYVKYPNVNLDDPLLEYINRQSIWIIYDDHRNDILVDKIEKTMKDHYEKIKGRSQARASISIRPDQSQLSGRPSGSVTVSGHISDHAHSGGRIYLHIPSFDPGIPPNSTTVHAFTIGADGRFSCELKLPGVRPGGASPVWYVEIRAEPAAYVVPLHIDTEGPPVAQGGSVPPDLGDQSGIDNGAAQMPHQMRRYSEGVLESIPRDIDSREFPRPEIGEICSILDREDRIVLTGDKGSGKSVIFCQLYKKLAGNRRVVLVRCDDFLQHGSLNDLDRAIGGGASVLDYLDSVRGGSAKTVLLLDSLDAVSRNSASMSLFRQFIQRAWSTGNVQTVCSVRTYDYEYSPEIGSVEWGTRVMAGDLSEKILDDVLESVGNHTVPDELKRILRNPLRLKIFHMIAARNPMADFANVKSEVRLYQEHWREYVDKSDRRRETAATLLDIAKLMIESRRTAVPRHAAAGPADGLESACSSGIISISGDHLRFFHHAYLDYVASKGILRNRLDIPTFLENNRYNAFLLPTIAFALSLIHDGSRFEYLGTVMSVCKSGLPYYWKIAAVRSLAELDGFSAEEVDPIGSLLDADHALQRHFLLEAGRAKNPFWLRVWSGRRMGEWSVQDYNASMLVDYLESLSAHKDLHSQMILLIGRIVGNEYIHPLIRQKAVEATAGMVDPSKASWYVTLSKHPDARVRAGVIPCLEGLLDTGRGEDADRAAEAFANIASYTEASREATPLVHYGTLSLASNKMQDNAHAVWAAGEAFPGLLAKRPAEMIGAAVESLERAGPAHRGSGDIVEDHSRMWYGKPDPSGRAKTVESIAKEMPRLLAKDAPKFARLLAASRPAVLHRILLDALAAQPGRFADMIFEELSRPGVLVLPSLRATARESIRLASPHLSRQQAEALLAGIMALGDPERRSTGALASYYLSAFDRSALSPEHLDVIKRWPPATASDRGRSAPPAGPALGRDEAPPPSPAQIVDRLLSETAGKEGAGGRMVDLGLLERAVDRAGDGSAGLDDGLAARLRTLFLRLAKHPDPTEDAPRCEAGGSGDGLAVHPTVRGLAARGLARLCARTRDMSLLPTIEDLSEDRINTVRSGVAEELEPLFGVDAGSACRIAARYSADADRRVMFYMPIVINLMAKKYPIDALAAVRNILGRREAAEYLAEYLPHALLFLALSADAPRAWDLLQDALEDASLPTEIRSGMPYALREGYLLYPATQDKALHTFSRLLDSKETEVREAASFFLLSPIKDAKAGDAAALIGKIGAHLDKIAHEADECPYNSQTIGTLLRFLRHHWHSMPDRALAWLEKISSMPYAAYQPAFMEEAVATLNEMFRSRPDERDRDRCLAVLDGFVKAGWPKAMDLLRKMGRPD